MGSHTSVPSSELELRISLPPLALWMKCGGGLGRCGRAFIA